jgi:hypothetical protein
MLRFLWLLMASPEVKPLLSSEHLFVGRHPAAGLVDPHLAGADCRCQAASAFGARTSFGCRLTAGWDDEPPPPSGNGGFASAPAKEKQRAKGIFRGLLLSNQAHRSSSDGVARLYCKSGGTGVFLSYLGHCLMENRHCQLVASKVTPADGFGVRAAAVRMARSLPVAHQKTRGADKGYDTRHLGLNLSACVRS